MDNQINTYAIILASGTGNRFGTDLPKQFTKIGEKTILEHTIEAFEKSKNIDKIILIITPGFKEKAEEIAAINHYEKICNILEGGETRRDSSFIAINSIDETEAYILIHDCARPLVSQKTIINCVNALKSYPAITVAIPATDTMVQVKNNIITNMPDRNELMRVQTPQAFKLSVIRKAHQLAKNDSEYTDDCSLILKNNLCPVHVINGDYENIKITYPQDIIIAQEILNSRNANP